MINFLININKFGKKIAILPKIKDIRELIYNKTFLKAKKIVNGNINWFSLLKEMNTIIL